MEVCVIVSLVVKFEFIVEVIVVVYQVIELSCEEKGNL